MIVVTYACGCWEEGGRSLRPRPCPIHGGPAVRVLCIGARAAELAFGGSLVEPDRPLFRPNLEASA